MGEDAFQEVAVREGEKQMNVWRSKGALVLWLALAVIVLASGSAAASQVAESGSLTIATWMDEGGIDMLAGQLAEADIAAEFISIPYGEYASYLITALGAAQGPDIFMVDDSLFQQFYELEALLELEVSSEGFIEDAVASVSQDGALYAVPWGRFACTHYYYSFAVNANTDYAAEAQEAVVYLTQPALQVANFFEHPWQVVPTRESAYEETGVDCGREYVALRNTPEERAYAMSVAEELQEILAEALDYQTLAIGLARVYDPENESESMAFIKFAAKWQGLPDDTPVVAVPVENGYTEEELLDTWAEGVVLGAMRWGDDQDYAVKCYGDGDALDRCELVDPALNTQVIDDVEVFATSQEISFTDVAFVEGSIIIEFYIDSRKIVWVLF